MGRPNSDATPWSTWTLGTLWKKQESADSNYLGRRRYEKLRKASKGNFGLAGLCRPIEAFQEVFG